MSSNVNAQIGRDHYQVKIEAGNNSITADEAEANGGGNKGFNPYELLLASLGACTCATLRMYADRKGMSLEAIHVSLALERDETKNETNITRGIEFTGNISPEDKDKLLQIANKCPVHKILSNPVHISTSLI